MKRVTFIGGPLNGRHEQTDKTQYESPIKGSYVYGRTYPVDPKDKEDAIAFYRRETFQTPGKDFYFMIERSLTVTDAIQLLINKYEEDRT